MRLPRNFDPSVISSGRTLNDPLARTSTNGPMTAADATRAATSAQSAAAGSGGDFPAVPNRLPVFYVYSMKVKNAGAKTIEGVAWDYLFIDTNNNRELGRHQFLSYDKVAANKDVTFKSQLRSPPVRVVAAANSKSRRTRYIERAVIQCVLYSDDTTWRNSQTPSDEICSLLKSGRALLKRKRNAAQSE